MSVRAIKRRKIGCKKVAQPNRWIKSYFLFFLLDFCFYLFWVFSSYVFKKLDFQLCLVHYLIMNLIDIHNRICRKAIDGVDYFTYSIPDNTRVKIHGFVMMRGLEDGKSYTVKRDEVKKIYWFCVPRTGKKVVGHYFDIVDFNLQCFPRGDNNCIQCVL